MSRALAAAILLAALAFAVACAHPDSADSPRSNPTAIDRFSAAAGHLMVRSEKNGLPAPGQPIDFDHPPFITQGLAADGSVVRYYNFDVQDPHPATLYRFTHAGAHAALAGQTDIVDVLPGDPGYSDFWRIVWVEVPDGYAANTIRDAAALRAQKLTTTPSDSVVDCPIVPTGSTAREANGVAAAVPTALFYRGVAVTCLSFGDPLVLDGGRVPTSPIYVTFASPGAFRSEGTTAQTHNVVMSLPGDVDYSPLWAVHVYDPAAFATVKDATTALAARVIKPDGPLVNCPVVAILSQR